jgi:hypothetical protein
LQKVTEEAAGDDGEEKPKRKRAPTKVRTQSIVFSFVCDLTGFPEQKAATDDDGDAEKPKKKRAPTKKAAEEK